MRLYFSGPRIMGIRPGISLGKEDFAAIRGANKSRMTGSFVYVIKDTYGNIKVGVSTDPIARLATLQTAHSSPLSLEYIGATSSDGYDIEAAAHALLAQHKQNGEWFAVPAAMAVGAINAASHQLNSNIVKVAPEWVPEIIRQSSIPDSQPKKSRTAIYLVIVFLSTMAIMLMLMNALKRGPLADELSHDQSSQQPLSLYVSQPEPRKSEVESSASQVPATLPYLNHYQRMQSRDWICVEWSRSTHRCVSKAHSG